MTLPPPPPKPKAKKTSKPKASARTTSTASPVVVRAFPASALRPNKAVLDKHRRLSKALHGSAPTKITVPRSWDGTDGLAGLVADIKAGLPRVAAPRPK